MNGSNFKNEMLFLSFMAIITTTNGLDGTNVYIGNRPVGSFKMSYMQQACQHHHQVPETLACFTDVKFTTFIMFTAFITVLFYSV